MVTEFPLISLLQFEDKIEEKSHTMLFSLVLQKLGICLPFRL